MIELEFQMRKRTVTAWGVAILCFVVLMLITPKIPQSQEYHNFADQREFFGDFRSSQFLLVRFAFIYYVSLLSVAVFFNSSLIWIWGFLVLDRWIFVFSDYLFSRHFSFNLITLFEKLFICKFVHVVLNYKLNFTFVFCFSPQFLYLKFCDF